MLVLQEEAGVRKQVATKLSYAVSARKLLIATVTLATRNRCTTHAEPQSVGPNVIGTTHAEPHSVDKLAQCYNYSC